MRVREHLFISKLESKLKRNNVTVALLPGEELKAKWFSEKQTRIGKILLEFQPLVGAVPASSTPSQLQLATE